MRRLKVSRLLSRVIPFPVAASLARRFLAIAGFGTATSVARSGEINAMRTAIAGFGARADGGLVFIDAGAHVGEWSQAALNGFPDARIHAFEPSATHRAQFSKAVLTSGRVQLVPSALGKSVGKATLHKDKSTTGLASMTKRDLGHFGIEMNIQEGIEVTTLDLYASQHGISRVDFLKIDVEGHELDVLTGAQGLLARGAVGAVQFEFGGSNIDTHTYFRDFFHLFATVGFQLHLIRPGGALVRIDRYREFYEQFTTTNFLAIKKNGGQ
jgi:FkbM family methyltransferase